MQARMKHPVMVLPAVMQQMLATSEAAKHPSISERLRAIVHLRASQINGCGFCVLMHSREMKKFDETEERIFSVAAWRESPAFTAPERAALALTEAVTRIADQGDPVPDELWREVEAHFDEAGRASLLLEIALVNVWNRLNVAVRQPAGQLPR